MEKNNTWEVLSKINVNDKTEKKNGLTYLSWAWAWAEFVKIYPNAKYKVIKNDNGMPYFKDESGAFCYTEVTAGDITHEMWLPVMDFRNQAIKIPTAFDINKTVMRCLTKNLAMFGLGLYIYAGEDLPEDNKTEQQPQQNTNLGDLKNKINDDLMLSIANAKSQDDLVKIYNSNTTAITNNPALKELLTKRKEEINKSK